MTTPASSPAEASPLQSFSHCHVGIVERLKALDHLPALLLAAEQARALAATSVAFFRKAVVEHHTDEERELFPAVLASAQAGDELRQVQSLVTQLTREHREIEARWKRLEPALRAVAKGQPAVLDVKDLAALVNEYQAHARFEEDHFLPLSQTILGRNSQHLAALGLSLHIRHVLPEVLAQAGGSHV